jgi:hypothetical protein
LNAACKTPASHSPRTSAIHALWTGSRAVWRCY